eukprot:sb/3469585/
MSSDLDELRKANRDLLNTLRRGQTSSWSALRTISDNVGRPVRDFSTPVKKFARPAQIDSNHSPICKTDHRRVLKENLDSSYSRLAANLRSINPDYMIERNNSSRMSDRPDSYFADLERFRTNNSQLCAATFSETQQGEDGVSVVEKPHQCVQTYAVGADYRARDSHAGTQCPLCVGADDSEHKGLIRVNIGNEDLVEYKVKPSSRSDPISLAAHCAPGCEFGAGRY